MCPQMSDSVTSLIQAVESHDHLTPSLCKRLLSESTITPDDLMPWADFDHPKADSYGRKLVHNGGHFELMVMSWVDGDMAAIHDHGYTQWGAVKLFGPAEHAIFRLQDGTLSTAERKVFTSGDVVAVGHDFIHQMGNVGQSPYMTLHLYGCYERDCDVTADANLYDLEEGSVRITSGGVFFDLPEDCVSRRVEGPKADFPTALRDRVELLQRMMRGPRQLGAGRAAKRTGASSGRLALRRRHLDRRRHRARSLGPSHSAQRRRDRAFPPHPVPGDAGRRPTATPPAGRRHGSRAIAGQDRYLASPSGTGRLGILCRGLSRVAEQHL